MNAIHTENLGKIYRSGWRRAKGAPALRGLNLEVKSGEVFGFLGPNGAGKTTAIHLILNLIHATSGSAQLFGQPASDAAVHRRVGYLPESVTFHNHYHGRGLLRFYAALTGMPRNQSAGRILEVLRLVKLEDVGDKPITKYSKGMLQRLGFAQALLHDPDLLILDEPTSNLDPVGRKEFRDILVELKRQGKTIFISSHVLSEVESVCDRVAILQQGELKRVGTLQELSAARGARFVMAALSPDLIASVAATSAQLTIQKDQVVIKCADEPTRRQVEQLLRDGKVPEVRVEAETQSLEEIFFSALQNTPQT